MTEVTTMMRQLVQSSVEKTRVDRNAVARQQSVEPSQGTANRQGLPQAGSTLPPASGERQVPAARLDRVVDDLNTYAQNLKREIRFSLDEGSGRTIIMVIDSISKEVVRQIPLEDIEKVSRNLHNQSSGIFVQTTV